VLDGLMLLQDKIVNNASGDRRAGIVKPREDPVADLVKLRRSKDEA
jgi:hypothetical protein